MALLKRSSRVNRGPLSLFAARRLSCSVAFMADFQQLVALQEQGKITMAQFLSMSKQFDVEEPAPEPEGGDAASPPRDIEENSADAGADADMADDASDDEDGSAHGDDEDGEEAAAESAAAPAAAPAATAGKVSINNSILNFISRNQPAPAKAAAPRKPGLHTHDRAPMEAEKGGKKRRRTMSEIRHEEGRGKSSKKQGTRLNDVKPSTMKLRLEQFPDQPLEILHGQLHCRACSRNIASGKSHCAAHFGSVFHLKSMQTMTEAKDNKTALKEAIHNYKSTMKYKHGDDTKFVGLETVPEDTQLFRAETLEEFVKAGVEVLKLDALRPFLERISGQALVGRQHLMTQYLPPLKLAEEKRVKDEFKNEFVGVYHDGTTHSGESFAVVYRTCKPGFLFRISCVRVHFLRGSMKATEISSVLFKTCGIAMEVRLACRTSSHLTATPAPQCPAKSCDASPVCRHLRSMCSLG